MDDDRRRRIAATLGFRGSIDRHGAWEPRTRPYKTSSPSDGSADRIRSVLMGSCGRARQSPPTQTPMMVEHIPVVAVPTHLADVSKRSSINPNGHVHRSVSGFGMQPSGN